MVKHILMESVANTSAVFTIRLVLHFIVCHRSAEEVLHLLRGGERLSCSTALGILKTSTPSISAK